MKYRQFIFKNFTTPGSSSSEVDDKTLSMGFKAFLAKSASFRKQKFPQIEALLKNIIYLYEFSYLSFL